MQVARTERTPAVKEWSLAIWVCCFFFRSSSSLPSCRQLMPPLNAQGHCAPPLGAPEILSASHPQVRNVNEQADRDEKSRAATTWRQETPHPMRTEALVSGISSLLCFIRDKIWLGALRPGNVRHCWFLTSNNYLLLYEAQPGIFSLKESLERSICLLVSCLVKAQLSKGLPTQHRALHVDWLQSSPLPSLC